MKTILTIFLLTSVSVFGVLGPTLTVQDARGNPFPLEIEEFKIDVQLVADVAETTITIGFRNDTDRMLEGEFAMSLPPGATVSRYALEVNGAMRESVAVEKRKARFAYESIKRQKIDPGYVEREAGNIYRTKIFPILKKSVKRVQLGYVVALPASKNGLRYELPIGEPGMISQVHCELTQLEGEELKVVESAGLPFGAKASAGLEAKGNNLEPSGTLIVTAPALEGREVLVEAGENGQRNLYVRMRAEPEPIGARPKPKAIEIVWDVSRSGGTRKHAREIAFLDGWFRAQGDVEVRLKLLRHKVIDTGIFQVKGGNWDKLRKLLESVHYDGATRFDLLSLGEVDADLLLFFTDGVSPFLPGAKTACPIVVLDASPYQESTAFSSLARMSGGGSIDLLALSVEDAVARSMQISPRVDLNAQLKDALVDDRRSSGKFLRLQCNLAADAGDVIEVDGSKIAWRKESTVIESGMVRRLWAQRKLMELERSHPHSREAIIEHGKNYNLVSDYTSLIVLERFEDYVRYRIPPPEPELREKWVKRTTPAPMSWYRFNQAWESKQLWYEEEFSWIVKALDPRLKQVTIWLQAMEQAFDEKVVDQKALAVFKNWRREALAMADRREEFEKKGEIESWRRSVAQLVFEGSKLRETPIALLPQGKEMVVSVRGLVANPGNVTGSATLSLRKAIEKAGSFSPLGSPTAVELYRNGGKKIYNMLSTRFEDVQLLPGDMIAVREYNPEIEKRLHEGEHWGPRIRPGDPRSYPPVFDFTDLWVVRDRYDEGGGFDGSDPFSSDLNEPDPFGGSDAGLGSASLRTSPKGRLPTGSLKGEIRLLEVVKGKVPSLEAFSSAVASGGDARAAYRHLTAKGGMRPETYVAAARVLFAHKKIELGEQVLSNLYETEVLFIDRMRSCVMWLGDFGQPKAAHDLLEAISRLAPDAPLMDFERAHLKLRVGDRAAVTELLSEIVQSAPGKTPTVAEIALTERNGLIATGQIPKAKDNVAKGGEGKMLQDESFESDIRIVVTTSHPEYFLGLTVSEPAGGNCEDRSPTGGRIEQTFGLSEYMLRRAFPGTYKIRCATHVPMTARVSLYKNWGRENQEKKEVTVWLPGHGEPVVLAEYEFRFSE